MINFMTLHMEQAEHTTFCDTLRNILVPLDRTSHAHTALGPLHTLSDLLVGVIAPYPAKYGAINRFLQFRALIRADLRCMHVAARSYQLHSKHAMVKQHTMSKRASSLNEVHIQHFTHIAQTVRLHRSSWVSSIARLRKTSRVQRASWLLKHQRTSLGRISSRRCFNPMKLMMAASGRN